MTTDVSTAAPDPPGMLRAALGLSRADFARMVGLSPRSVASWESGVDLKPAAVRTIVEVDRLRVKLAHAFTAPNQFAAWLKSPLELFGGATPLEVIERGEIDRIWQLLYFVESGEMS